MQCQIYTNEFFHISFWQQNWIKYYKFRGITGTDFSKCLSFICDNKFKESKIENLALKSSLESNVFVIPDTFVERMFFYVVALFLLGKMQKIMQEHWGVIWHQ